jgi:pyridoxine 5-phosphate synthase
MSRALLSINVNKYALVRNSRGRNVPNLLDCADACIAAGARGITVHPRRDERHIRMADVPVLAKHLRQHHPTIEYNVECEPHDAILDMVLDVHPEQCTLVPVSPGEVTSDHGWNLPADTALLAPVLTRLRADGIRSSIFMGCTPEGMARAADVGTDRVELYTGPYAWGFGTPNEARETERIFATARAALLAGVGLNAGHDLDRFNLVPLQALPGLREVSIGHAHVCRALEIGTAKSIVELNTALGWPAVRP